MAAKKNRSQGARRANKAQPSAARADESEPLAKLPAQAQTASTVSVEPPPSPVIVGIGGSAGSLTPLRELLGAIPADSGLAFVVVSHQSATGKSLLPEILGSATQMVVSEIDGAMRLEPNHVYVLPRGHSVEVRGSTLLIERVGASNRVPLPIDHFFRSLAQDLGSRAVGIVLSGTGTDGTLGLAAIHAEGGLCLAQAPETAEFDSMPTSAIAAKVIDFALPVGGMFQRLLGHAKVGEKTGGRSRLSSSEMDQILALIRLRTGRDFSAYKRETLVRRVERRMQLNNVGRFSDYASLLGENEQEIDALWRDWLIGVTGFFRDPEAFRALAESGLPPLIASRTDDPRFRVWVPGCSTGEEAYSVAILMLEALEALDQHSELQVFATDLDPIAIDTARAGRFPKSIAGAVGAKRLSRFFVEEDNGYRVKKSVRDRIVFAVQDALHDPPFTRVDLISCRNLLIYVNPDAQQILLSVFRYSLNAGGLLLLGASENVASGDGSFFTTLDKRWKLFRRAETEAVRPAARLNPRPKATELGVHAAHPFVEGRNFDLTDTLRACLAERFGPPAVVVDLRGQIQQTHGRVGPYLELPPGRANLNVVEMARVGLRMPLMAALREIKKAGIASVEKDVRWEAEGKTHTLRLRLARIEGRRLPHPLLLVSFEAALPRNGPGREHKASSKGSRPTLRSEVAQLEEDLRNARGELEISVSELQAANEELASSNEEVQSANEELQSSNEELQTSKEETQSLNEELQTVNAELVEKLRGFAQSNDDLENLMTNIEIATIFLDDRLRVKRFTPQARNIARLIDSDLGRPLADLATSPGYADLLTDAASVLETLRPTEKLVPGADGIWYTVRIRPYRTARNAVEGLVITFIDVTETKRSERTQAARALADSIVDAVHEPLLVLDPRLFVIRANRSYYRVFGVTAAETEGKALSKVGDCQWDNPRLRGFLEATLREGIPFEDFELVCEFPRLGKRNMLLSGRPVTVADGSPVLLVLGIHDQGEVASISEKGPGA